MSCCYVSEVEARTHGDEARAMHASIQSTASGRAVSDFIVKTCVAKMADAHETSIAKTMELSKVLMTAINQHEGLERTGFIDDSRELPKFIALADLMGRRVAAWSQSATLIRELCACFYGPNSAHFGHGSVLRHEIDCEAKLAAQEGATLCLVLVSPWGESLADRFWRLMTVRKTESGAYRDSERVMTSMQTPPTKPGMSVLGDRMECTVPPRIVDAFLREWRAVNLESASLECGGEGDGEGSGEGSGSAGAREIGVLRGIVSTLRGENARLQESLNALKLSKEVEVQAKLDALVTSERSVFYADIASLHTSLDAQSSNAAIDRVRAEALEADLREADAEIGRLGCFVSELKGEVLVAQESSTSSKKSKQEEVEKLRDAIKNAKAEAKRVESARREEVRQLVAERARAQQLEAQLEGKRVEVEAANAELQISKQREATLRDTMSEHTGRLMDINQRCEEKIDAHERTLARVRQAKLPLLREVALRVRHARDVEALVCKFAVRMMRMTRRPKMPICSQSRRNDDSECSLAPTRLGDDESEGSEEPEAVEAVEAAVRASPAPSIQLESFPADAVASANATIAMLKRFVDVASGAAVAPSNAAASPSASPTFGNYHAQQQPFFHAYHHQQVYPQHFQQHQPHHPHHPHQQQNYYYATPPPIFVPHASRPHGGKAGGAGAAGGGKGASRRFSVAH